MTERYGDRRVGRRAMERERDTERDGEREGEREISKAKAGNTDGTCGCSERGLHPPI